MRFLYPVILYSVSWHCPPLPAPVKAAALSVKEKAAPMKSAQKGSSRVCHKMASLSTVCPSPLSVTVWSTVTTAWTKSTAVCTQFIYISVYIYIHVLSHLNLIVDITRNIHVLNKVSFSLTLQKPHKIHVSHCTHIPPYLSEKRTIFPFYN